MKKNIFAMVAGVLAYAACFAAGAGTWNGTPTEEASFARQHVFMVDNEGWCIDPCWKWNLPGGTNSINIYRDAFNPIEEGIRAWCQTNSAPDKRVVIFVHGGLNAYSASEDRMGLLGPIMMTNNCYPIFVVWNSGLPSSYWDHLVHIRQGEEHHIIGWSTALFVFVSDLAKGVVRLPLTASAQFYNDARTTEWPRNATNCPVIKPVATARWEGFECLINSNIPGVYHPPQAELNRRSWSNRNTRFAEYVLTLPTKVVTLPILDGLGTEAWDIMLRRTRTMFELSSVYETADKLQAWQTETPNATNFAEVKRWLALKSTNNWPDAETTDRRGAMALFGKSLSVWSTNYARLFGATNLDFEFYGHSMGAIVLNEMFLNQPDIKAKRIVYLGAACSVEDFENALFPYLRENTNVSFYSISLHRMAERQEYSLYSVDYVKHIPVLRDLIVRGSLLNWIDNIFQSPNAISDRTLGSWENITRALPDVPEYLRVTDHEQVHFRCCDIEPVDVLVQLGGTYEPQEHGEFSMARFWDPDFFWPAGTNQLRLLTQ